MLTRRPPSSWPTRLLRFLTLAPLTVALAGCPCNIRDADEDGIDQCQDCDDENADLGLEMTLYADGDADGYGAEEGKKTCEALDGWVDNNGDCNDRAAEFHPDAEETCNNFDDNCDGEIDEGCGADSGT